jgi:hypothetical protein
MYRPAASRDYLKILFVDSSAEIASTHSKPVEANSILGVFMPVQAIARFDDPPDSLTFMRFQIKESKMVDLDSKVECLGGSRKLLYRLSNSQYF